MKGLILILAIVVPISASAKLGDTKETSIRRYGTPVNSVGDSLVFTYKQWRILECSIQIQEERKT